ncbi:PAS domain S-box protein [bacterium]|nr:PAS domain S-box protein [bacterium]
MNFVSLMDLAAATGSLAALLFIFFASRRTTWKPEIILFTLIIILTFSHDVGNFLEWAGYTNWFDPAEDFLETLTAALWAFFFYTFLQELNELKLRQIQELDEKILDGSPVAFVLRGSDLRVLKVSRAFKKVTGYDPAFVIGKSIEEFMPDMPGRQELEARHKKVLESGEQVGPTEVKAPSPVPRYIRETIFPVSGLEGNVTNTLSVLEDITAQVEAERKLKEVQELDEKILDGSPVAFVLHDLDMRIIRVSSAYEKVTGFKIEDVQGRTLKEFMPDGSQKDGIIQRIEYVQEQMVQVGPKDIESPVLGHYLRETILPIFSPEGRLVNTLTVLEDITEQKHAREALEESESRYKMLFDSIHDGVVVHEIEEDGRPGRFLEVNRTFCQMTGYSRKELLKITPLDLSETTKFNKADSVRNTLLGGGSTSFERTIISKAGATIPCEMKAHSFQMGDKQVVLSVVRDITERKKAHDNISSSLAEKETLLREIHHRVKNNLQVISGLLNLQSHYIDDEGVRAIYKESQNRIKTMALIHEELYQREDLARINLAEYLSALAGNLMASYSMTIGRVSLDLDLEDAEITIDTAIPCGLIVNEIVSNSLTHAFPDNGEGKIQIKLKLLDGEKFELTISDDGMGLPADLEISKTKTLGLRLVSILAEQLGADLQVEKGQGTAFRLTFQEYLEAGTEMY